MMEKHLNQKNRQIKILLDRLEEQDKYLAHTITREDIGMKRRFEIIESALAVRSRLQKELNKAIGYE